MSASIERSARIPDFDFPTRRHFTRTPGTAQPLVCGQFGCHLWQLLL